MTPGGEQAATGIELRDRAGCELIAEALRSAAGVRIRALGTSMLPSVWPGDVLVVQPARGSIPRVGEIALCYRSGRLFAHRVVKHLDGDGATRILTRGDALSDCDPPIEAGELLGSVGAIFRNGRPVPVGAEDATVTRRIVALAVSRAGLMRRAWLAIHALRRRRWQEFEARGT